MHQKRASLFIFGVRIDCLSRKNIVCQMDHFMKGLATARIVTVNPEFLLLARKDARFRTLLNAGTLNVADGVGLHIAFWRLRRILPDRFTGADMAEHLLSFAQKNNARVFCAVRKDGLSSWKNIRRAIHKKYPSLHLDGVMLSHTNTLPTFYSQHIRQRIMHSDIVLCNFGIPYQERFTENVKALKSPVKIVMGIGGTFDFWTNTTIRAPKTVQKMGLEWLWRWKQQPRRWKRILKAVILFPLLILFTQINEK